MSACLDYGNADIGSLIARLHSYVFALLSLRSSATTSLLVEVRFNVLSIGNTPRALTVHTVIVQSQVTSIVQPDTA